MNKKYDIIVIGGGHNGLTTACMLAKSGKKVLVIEKRSFLGGIAAGEEFHPGFFTDGLLHDTSGIRRKVITELELEKFGLSVKDKRPDISLLSAKGECLHLYVNLNKALEEISKYSEKDCLAYASYRRFIEDIKDLINHLLDEFPLDSKIWGSQQVISLIKKSIAFKKLGKKTMLEFLKVAPMSVSDFLNEKFETDFLKAGLSGPAIYGSTSGPMSSYTTLNLLIWECTARIHIQGGPQALIDALEKTALHHSVEILKGNPVNRILLNDKHQVCGVKLVDQSIYESTIVASSCTPQVTFLNLFRPNQIGYALEQSIDNYRSRGTTAKVHLAIDQGIKLNGQWDITYARTGNTFAEMEKAFDHSKYRAFSKSPVLDLYIPTIENPELAPNAHHVMSIIVHFAPYHLATAWSDQEKERLYKNVIQTLEIYAPKISDAIIGHEVLSPLDLEQRYSLSNGHIYHGEHAIDQLVSRPFPSCSNYKTPIPGLYLCGSGSHPGGGITCMPGYLSAKKILRE